MSSCILLQVWHPDFVVDFYALLMDMHPQPVELRFGILTSGTQCVMIAGALLMQKLCAVNLATKELQLPIQMPILVKDQVEYFWMIWTAPEQRHLFYSAHTMDSTATTVTMMKMQV